MQIKETVLFDKSKYIWIDDKSKDIYVSFYDCFYYSGEQEIMLNIHASTLFIAYVNDKKVLCGQFAGYDKVRYFEQIPIKNFCKKGKNLLKITVWYEGINSFTHIDCGGGLIYLINSGDKIISFSNENTVAKRDYHYIHGRKKILTIQLGYTSAMVSKGGEEKAKTIVLKKDFLLLQRPVENLAECKKVKAKKIAENLYDLKKEYCGYFTLTIESDKDCIVNVAYGEHLYFGSVARLLSGGYKNAGRDFSFDFYCKKGKNIFTQYYIRCAGRYFYVSSSEKIKVKTIGIIPIWYPTEDKKKKLKGIDKKIYDTCIRTLKLCMHDHYEDCPWREQSLYTLDARNQMLCGYYAFYGYDYQRANLIFMKNGLLSNGILELTYPAKDTPAIPFFSLIYVIAIREYIEHSKDVSIINEVFTVLEKIIQAFTHSIDEQGLIANFPKPFWNFYEWSEGSSHEEELEEDFPREIQHDLILNCAYLYSVMSYKKICEYVGKKTELYTRDIGGKIIETFYDKEKGLFYLSDKGEKRYSQLGNALSILVGLGDDKIAEALKYNDNLIQATLSTKCFVYDALLKYDVDINRRFIIEEIRKNYSSMLDKGATSFWETLEGVSEKDEACSLCHGWSAMPVYYYNTINIKGFKNGK